MEVINLLEFLNTVKNIYTLDYARCDGDLVNFLDLMTEDEQFTRSIDLGIMYLCKNSQESYIIVDGLRRILSLSLLLHAVCECYKKTSPRNDMAIKTIRSKYLLFGSNYKLHLPEKYAELYKKIIDGERLSSREKESDIFKLFHSFWVQIKEENLHASKIFRMLQKIHVTVVETGDISKRDLYYRLNIDKKLDQIILIEDFLKEKNLLPQWEQIRNTSFVQRADVISFFRDYFITKFNYKTFKEERLYESFINYYKTMTRYLSQEKLMEQIKLSAGLYYNIVNMNFSDSEIRHAFIQIKKYSGEDTYAYILNVYEDYYLGNISESIFLEILNTIIEYLKNRKQNSNDIDFNELIQYLNAFITCK